MFIAKNDEEQRSRIWRAVVLVSTALIILIAIFLLTKMFTSNPVEGTWKDENGNYKFYGRMDLSIHGSGSADVTLLDFQEQDKVEVPLAYSIDKDAKTITFSYDDAKLKSVADKSKGAYSENDLETALESLASTYTYSVDRECLTLTESEYGDQMVLDKE